MAVECLCVGCPSATSVMGALHAPRPSLPERTVTADHVARQRRRRRTSAGLFPIFLPFLSSFFVWPCDCTAAACCSPTLAHRSENPRETPFYSVRFFLPDFVLVDSGGYITCRFPWFSLIPLSHLPTIFCNSLADGQGQRLVQCRTICPTAIKANRLTCSLTS